MFRVKEIFLTLQGEGHNAGRRAVFVRFAGCNMWSGLEKDRAKGKAACSRWCDTDFVGGEKLAFDDLVDRIDHVWGGKAHGLVVFTGGEPALQLTPELFTVLRRRGFNCAVETNGSLPLPEGVYWRTVSPKTKKLAVTSGNEIKLVFPTLPPEDFAHLDFRYFYLQPLDNAAKAENTALAVEYIKANPQWRLSLQTHKTIGIP